MRNHTIVLALSASVAAMVPAAGCKAVVCGDGTIERDGRCEPADITTGAGLCGPFTELQGDRCSPQFPPTVCDPTTTMEDFDPATGVTTCIGTGGGGCGAPFACPAPSGSTKQTICGQLYDFANNTKLADAGASGAKCPSTPSASGPCALQILAYDAIAFGTNPQTAVPLPVGGVYIDDCGRYRVTDIEIPGGPFIGLGFDDAGQPLDPTGVTVTVGVATPRGAGTATKDLEGWIVSASTTTSWSASGGPPLSGGIYAAVFRQHKLGNGDPLAPQPGVTITKSGNPIPANDHYFTAAETGRLTIDPSAIATGANGTVLVTNASVMDSLVYAGSGGLGANCRWEPHAAASLSNIVFIQVYRKLDPIIGSPPCLD